MSDVERHNWRITPSATVAAAVMEVAVREHRTLTNTLSKLLMEALAARAIAEGAERRSAAADADRLISILKVATS